MILTAASFRDNLERVRAAMAAACDRAGRGAGEVALLPVTKGHGPEAARLAWEAGLEAVGENRVQEALGKREAAPAGLRWELIGPLQSNKAARAAEAFARIQSVDRAKIVQVLERRLEAAGRERLPVLLQVNAGADPRKAGVSVEEAPRLLEAAAAAERLEVQGLMTIAPYEGGAAAARRCFAALRELRDRLEAAFGVRLPQLSMGMSGDLAEAILEGSTVVRVGSSLFGERKGEGDPED